MRSRIEEWIAAHGYPFAAFVIGLSTAVFLVGRSHVVTGQWGVLYLLIVVVVAGASGTGPAVLAAVLSFFAWDFFIPPYGTLNVADSRDWLMLIAFLTAGVLMGVQTGRLRERSQQAVARARETQALAHVGSALIAPTSPEVMAEAVLAEVQSRLGASRASLYVPRQGGPRLYERSHGAGQVAPHSGSCPPNQSAASATFAEVDLAPQTPLHALPEGSGLYALVGAGGIAGILTAGPRCDGRPYSEANVSLLTAFANQVASFLERERLHGVATQAEVARQADQLKSSLLSSVSHELRTPLAALMATVSNLLEDDLPWDEQAARGELRSIVADGVRLNNCIGSLLDLSRLEAHAWAPRREPCELAEIVDASLDRVPAHLRTRVQSELPDELPLVEIDFGQWLRVFQNLLENALLYGGEQGTVRVSAESEAKFLRLWVEDDGPGIASEQREAVFEKFYRSPRSLRDVPFGTGLGLAIVREIVQAHQGTIRIEDVVPHGARFVIELPLEAPKTPGLRRAAA